jgi:hypothetical protein
MLPASYATPAAIVIAVGGLLACFAGYRLFRVVLGLYGFVCGALFTTHVMGAAAGTWTLIVAAFVGGLVGALLMYAAYFIGVGLVGAGLAALALNVAWRFIGGDVPTVALVIGCVLGALLALSVARYVVIVGTALAGAWTLIVGAMALMGNRAAMHAASATDVWIFYPLDPQPGRWWLLPTWIALALAGAVVQLGTSKPKSVRTAAKPVKK